VANGKTALMLAAGTGNFECVEILTPFENEMSDDSGYTALMLAAA